MWRVKLKSYQTPSICFMFCISCVPVSNCRRVFTLIVETDKNLENYKKIFDFIEIDVQEIKSNWDITDLILWKKWLFLCNIDIFKQKNINKNKIIYESLYLKSWNEINIEKVLEKLIKIWYKFSEYNSKWSYNKIWDIININSFSWNKQYKINLWWDTIEEIIEVKTNYYNSETNSLKEIYIWGNKKVETQENFDLENISFLDVLNEQKDIFNIIDSLEFSIVYEKLNKNLENFCSFDFIKNPFLQRKDLCIESPKILNIEEFNKYLKENGNKEITIITKNSKQIKNFLEFNEVSWVDITETNL